MPYSYLTIDEQQLTTGIVDSSYFPDNLQELYEQSLSDQEKFFGSSPYDIIECSIYNADQEILAFNRIYPTVTFSVIQGSYYDINNILTEYDFNKPFTNYAKFNNQVLLNTRDFIKQSDLSPGLYFVLYNFIRNIAGNPDYKLAIKEVSPSRKEIRLSYGFNTDSSPEADDVRIRAQAFADKKFLFLQLSNQINQIIDNNPISVNFRENEDNFNYLEVAQNLGLKSQAELQQFIIDTYVGYDKIITLSSNDTSIKQTSKFIGIDTQIKNFTYTYNDTEFTESEILLAFKTIVAKVSQDRILQKTSLNEAQLEQAIEVFVKVIYTDWLETQTSDLLENYANRYFGLFKNALNFGNGNLIKILDHANYFNTIDGQTNIQVKLDEPLPLEYDIRSTCWVSNISLSPLYFKANVFSEAVKRNVSLNGVNFDVTVNVSNASNEPFESNNEDSLLYAKLRVQQKINDLLVDYDNFSNFILYSSAELRTKIAKNKILDYDQKETKKNLLSQTSSLVTTPISASYAADFEKLTKEQIYILNSFDEYESYLFFNTSSINEKIEDGVDYDLENPDSLINQLPEYVREDQDSLDYLKFTSMVGHFFDNIMLYIKKFPKTYPLGMSENSDYPKNYLDELLNSFSWDTLNLKLQNSDMTQFLFNDSQFSGSLSSSYFEYGKSILNRFANNLPYIYKTKGTANSLELIRSIFGIPAELVNIREYGSTDVTVNRQNYYDFEDILYFVRIKDDRYIKFDYKPQYYTYLPLVKYTETGSAYSSSWSTGSSGFYPYTSSVGLIEEFTSFKTIESTFRFKTDNYDKDKKIPIIQKTRNGKLDWKVYVQKTQQKQSGKLVFDIHPYESGYTSSIVSDELPYFNGSLYTFMVNRDILGSYALYDSDNTASSSLYSSSRFVSNSVIINLSSSFTSSAAEKYVPYEYKLSVNQYEGSLKNFYSKKTKIINYAQNQYFSSGSFYVGNYNTNINFNGNIDKIKVFRESVSDEDFDEHSYNLDSISSPTKSTVYDNLLYLWSFDTPVELWPLSASNPASLTASIVPNQNIHYTSSFTAFNFAGEYVTLPYPKCVPAFISEFPYEFDKVVLKQALNANNFGPNYKNNVKINKIDEFASSNLVPYDYSTGTKDIIGADSNIVGFYISPYSYLEGKIEDFLGKEGITDVIGDPKYLTSQNYPELDVRLKEFSSTNQKYIYPQEFYSTYKFYIDFTIFDYIKNVIPNRASLKNGLLIEPSILERKKFNYKDVTYNVSGLYTSSINFDNSAKLSPTSTTGSSMNISMPFLNTYDTDRDQYNFSRFEIPSSIDDRDFIYAKYGKYIDVDSNGFHIRNTYNVSDNDYYQMRNDNGQIVTFTASFDRVSIVGSGSVTGSSALTNIYRGIGNSGYSERHLSKQTFAGSRDTYTAVSGSNFVIINGVKRFAPAKLNFYTYIKGKNDSSTTVNRKGVPNGSSPVTTIPGYLSLNISSSNSPIYGTTTGSVGDPNNLFVPLPLTASMETSASLEEYIMNL